MYQLTLSICPIGELKAPIEVNMSGDNIFELKGQINESIINALKWYKGDEKIVTVDMLIEKDGEYYDHDEAWVQVNTKYRTIKFLEWGI
jgi:hypothetical protein